MPRPESLTLCVRTKVVVTACRIISAIVTIDAYNIYAAGKEVTPQSYLVSYINQMISLKSNYPQTC